MLYGCFIEDTPLLAFARKQRGMAEIIPTSVLKLSKKILGHLTSRDTSNNYPWHKQAKILCDNFSLCCGVNSHNNLLTLRVRKLCAH